MFKNLLLAGTMLLALVSCEEKGGTTVVSDPNAGVVDPKATEEKTYVKPVVEDEKACNTPKTMRDLSGGMKKIFYQFTTKNSGSLGLFGIANLTLGKKEVMVVVDFMQYKDQKCSGESVRYGVGARLFLHIKKIQGGISITDLPKLAAGVEYGKSSVTYSVEVIGLTGHKVRAALPNTGDFNVEAYGKVISAVDKIQMLANDGEDGVVIDPQVIPTSN